MKYFNGQYEIIPIIKSVPEKQLDIILKRIEKFCLKKEIIDESRISKDNVYEIEPGIEVLVMKRVPCTCRTSDPDENSN